MDKLRQTGRTTRMLQEAIRLQAEGEPVVVVMANVHHASEARAQTGNEIVIIPANYSEWSWSAMRLRGYSADTVYLIDHYAIEKRYADILRILHQFDA